MARAEPHNEDGSPPHRKARQWRPRWRIRWSKKKLKNELFYKLILVNRKYILPRINLGFANLKHMQNQSM